MKNIAIDNHNNGKKISDYEIIANLLNEYKDKELSNEYIKTCLDWVDIVKLFKCIYFSELELDYYEKLYDKYRKKYNDPNI